MTLRLMSTSVHMSCEIALLLVLTVVDGGSHLCVSKGTLSWSSISSSAAEAAKERSCARDQARTRQRSCCMRRDSLADTHLIHSRRHGGPERLSQ